MKIDCCLNIWCVNVIFSPSVILMSTKKEGEGFSKSLKAVKIVKKLEGPKLTRGGRGLKKKAGFFILVDVKNDLLVLMGWNYWAECNLFHVNKVYRHHEHYKVILMPGVCKNSCLVRESQV